MKSANYAPVYCALYPQLAETARDHGYALCIHGSLGRDMDLVCVPWVEAPSTPGAVVEAITSKFSLKVVGDAGHKLHGRISYVISIAFGECFIDLSFMAAQTPPPRLTGDELWKFWWDRPEVPYGEDDSTEAQFVAAGRAIETAVRKQWAKQFGVNDE